MEALGSSPLSPFPQDLTMLNTAQDDKGRF